MKERTDSFSVYTYSLVNIEEMKNYSHWAKGLNMVITKNGEGITLNESEIIELVQSLPRTVGGKY